MVEGSHTGRAVVREYEDGDEVCGGNGPSAGGWCDAVDEERIAHVLAGLEHLL